MAMKHISDYPEKIAIIGNHLPRKCGIATFTTDLANAISAEFEDGERVMVVAMDDRNEGYDYPGQVKFEIRDNIPTDYIRASEYLNVIKPDIVILQHEYGIFGGECGVMLFQLLKNLKTPLITTLHTILLKPSKKQKAIVVELGKISDQLVVMGRKSRELLLDLYGIPGDKITIIPHGIHDIPFVDTCYYKDKFGLEGRKVILTFGLIGPDKGIEYMIEAMPYVIERHPDAAYLVLGTTHPHVIRDMGDSYRHGLQQRVQRLGLEKHVIFFNQFVDLKSLGQFLSIADVYVTPYPEKEQIISGALSYAMGAGKVVVSTPYLCAEELLANGRGVIVPFADSAALAHAVSDLLSSEGKRNRIRKRAYQYCRPMVWKEVARSYLSLSRKVIEQNGTRLVYNGGINTKQMDSIPDIHLGHLKNLTDDTGIFQHSFFSIPDRAHGYCLDDNARALIVACRYHSLKNDEDVIPYINTYLSFVINAFNEENGRFRNFLSFDRKWLEDAGSEDSHGRALWGLGVAINALSGYSIINGISQVFMKSVKCVETFKYPRAWAFALLGIDCYLKMFSGDADVRKIRANLSDKLFRVFRENATDTWLWFEDILTYCNAKLPYALLLSGESMGRKEMIEYGLKILRWLLEIQTGSEGQLSVIGTDGWMKKSGERARFDQQPVEVLGLVEACIAAFRITEDVGWQREAQRCFNWFLGRNDLNIPVCDYRTGGCYDGLEARGINQNMGAESTLAWLISLLTMHSILGHEVIPDKIGIKEIE